MDNSIKENFTVLLGGDYTFPLRYDFLCFFLNCNNYKISQVSETTYAGSSFKIILLLFLKPGIKPCVFYMRSFCCHKCFFCYTNVRKFSVQSKPGSKKPARKKFQRKAFS